MNRNAVLQRKWVEIAKFLQTAVGQFCLVSYWLMALFPIFFITPGQQKDLPSGYLRYLSISQRLLAKPRQFLAVFLEAASFSLCYTVN
jgi:hypothetical protein